ncbi:unnamed protein product, partial [Didymodactylos carnosus]
EQGSIGYALTCYIHSHAQIVQSLIDYFKSISNQTSMIETKLTPNNKIQFDFGYDKHLNSSHLVQVYRSTVGQLLIEIKFLCYPLKIVAKLICLPCPPGTYMIKKQHFSKNNIDEDGIECHSCSKQHYSSYDEMKCEQCSRDNRLQHNRPPFIIYESGYTLLYDSIQNVTNVLLPVAIIKIMKTLISINRHLPLELAVQCSFDLISWSIWLKQRIKTIVMCSMIIIFIIIITNLLINFYLSNKR